MSQYVLICWKNRFDLRIQELVPRNVQPFLLVSSLQNFPGTFSSPFSWQICVPLYTSEGMWAKYFHEAIDCSFVRHSVAAVSPQISWGNRSEGQFFFEDHRYTIFCSQRLFGSVTLLPSCRTLAGKVYPVKPLQRWDWATFDKNIWDVSNVLNFTEYEIHQVCVIILSKYFFCDIFPERNSWK